MVLEAAGDTSLLLGEEDVPPVLEENAAGSSPFLLTCDHYGRALPRSLGDLGLPQSELSRHIAWDIGIAGVANALSKHLDAHLIAQRYSRLVIDCNRPLAAPGSIPRISEATVIPGNEAITREAAQIRRQARPGIEKIDAREIDLAIGGFHGDSLGREPQIARRDGRRGLRFLPIELGEIGQPAHRCDLLSDYLSPSVA